MIVVAIKICGNTRAEDLVKATALGVNYLGFIFYPPSPRYIEPAKAKDIIALAKTQLNKDLPKKVGVFVNESKKNIIEIARKVSLDIIQLHGDESPAFASSLELPFWKVLKITDTTTPESLAQSLSAYQCDSFLLDSSIEKEKIYGGTGKTFNWQIFMDYRKLYGYGTRCILAGGLNLDNIQKAFELAVDGFDLNSGIEDAPGVKNHQKMEKIVDAIRGNKKLF